MLTPRLKTFVEYLKTFGRYFGDDVLTLFGFISIYLNYDTDRNPFRRAIFDCSKKCKEQINLDCLNFVKLNRENPKENSFLNQEEFFGNEIIVSKRLHEFLSIVQDTDMKFPDDTTIHDFMFQLFKASDNEKFRITEYFHTVFAANFYDVMKDAESYLLNMDKNDEVFVIPAEYSYCMTVVDGKREEYGFDAGGYVKDLLWNCMLKTETTNIALYGLPYGKLDNYIYDMAYQLEHARSCPKRRDVIIVEVDVEAIYSKHAYDKDIIKAIKEINEYLLKLKQKRRVVIYLKNFTSLVPLGDEKCDDSYLFMLMPLLTDKHLRVIITLTGDEPADLDYVRYPRKMFTIVATGSLFKDEEIKYITGNALKLALMQGVNITNEDIDMAIQFAKVMGFNSIHGALDVLDIAMGYANSQGREALVREDYVEYFRIKFSEFEKNTTEYKSLLAYHEAGHFVLSRFSKYYKALYSDLVSIISVGDAGGVNIMEYDSSAMKDFGYNFYLEHIARILAGRASEELFLEEMGISSGAESDLKIATDIATDMVARLGLDKENNFSIKGNESLRSERSLNEVADKVDEIMKEAYDLAKKVLLENKDYVHSLTKLLLKEKIISRNAIMGLEVEKNGKVYLKDVTD